MSDHDPEGFLIPDLPAKRPRSETASMEVDEDIDPSLLDVDPDLLDSDIDVDAILESAEDIPDFDSASLKKVGFCEWIYECKSLSCYVMQICLRFEKAINKNQELRVKFAKQPEK